jgi:hypothetical protein
MVTSAAARNNVLLAGEKIAGGQGTATGPGETVVRMS